MSRFPKIYNPYLTAAIATVGGMLFGFDISSVSAFQNQDEPGHYRDYFHYPSTLAQGGITASMAGGSFLGSLAAGYFSDLWGRRPVIQVSSLFWIVGSAIQCSSIDQAQLICGRLISGFGIGFASSQVPVYIAELSPKHIRGRLVGLFQWAVTWGIMIMFYIGYGCSFIDGPNSFRAAWGLQMVPGALLLFGTLFLEESPRWLAKKDRWEEAINIIAQVQAKGDENDAEVLIEIEEIKEVVRIERENQSLTFFDLFKKDSINRTMVGMWAQIWQQLCGMNVIMYYTTTVFKMAGYSGNSNLVASSIQYVVFVIMTVPALFFIDRWGRRPLLLVGAVLMMTWLFAEAGLFATYGKHVTDVGGDTNIRMLVEHPPAAKAIIACSYLFVASFGPTWGPGIWIYCSEIFPLRQRALANGLTAASNWIFNFALAMFTPSAFKNITWKTYLLFGIFCVAMFFHVLFFFPETKDKTLEEIEQMWDARIPAWRTASWQPRYIDVEEIRTAGGGRPPSVSDKIDVVHEENVSRVSSTVVSAEKV